MLVSLPSLYKFLTLAICLIYLKLSMIEASGDPLIKLLSCLSPFNEKSLNLVLAKLSKLNCPSERAMRPKVYR